MAFATTLQQRRELAWPCCASGDCRGGRIERAAGPAPLVPCPAPQNLKVKLFVVLLIILVFIVLFFSICGGLGCFH